jgi:hypothetical protein
LFKQQPNLEHRQHRRVTRKLWTERNDLIALNNEIRGMELLRLLEMQQLHDRPLAAFDTSNRN